VGGVIPSDVVGRRIETGAVEGRRGVEPEASEAEAFVPCPLSASLESDQLVSRMRSRTSGAS
jgi:hypothetical protein